MSTPPRLLTAAALAAGLCIPAAAGAAPGDLDATYGTGGIVFDPTILAGLGEDETGLIDVTALQDGGAVARATERCGMECVERPVRWYSPTGDRVSAPPAASSGARALEESWQIGSAVAADGSVRLLIGRAGGQDLLTLARGGAWITTVPAEVAAVPAAVDEDGSVLAVTTSPRSLVRLRPDGALERAFGVNGAEAVPASATQIAGVAPGSVIRVAVTTRDGVALWRLRGDGTPIGVPSRVAVARWRGADALTTGRGGLAVGRSGAAMIVGTTLRRTAAGGMRQAAAIVAFRANGSPDRRFGTRGVMVLTRSEAAVAVQRNGKVVVATTDSFGRGGSARPLEVWRLNADGSPDPSFGPVRIPTSGRRPGAPSVGLDAAGRVLVGASAMGEYGHSGLLLARLRGGEAPALRLSDARRAGARTLRVAATSSVAGPARITVRQAGRVVGAATVRFTAGSRRTVDVPLHGAAAARPLALSGTLRGVRATGALRVRAS